MILANGRAKTHRMLIGFAYTVPPVLIWIALTRHTPPLPPASPDWGM